MLKKKIDLEPKIPYLGTFKQKFEKTFVLFEISKLDFVKMQIFM